MENGDIYSTGFKLLEDEVHAVYIMRDCGNSVICAPIVPGANRIEYPAHVSLKMEPFKNSTILLEQTMTIKKDALNARLFHKMCHADEDFKKEVQKAFVFSMCGEENCQ